MLKALYPDGMPSDMEIISDSPNIHLKYNATSTNDRLPPKRLVELVRDLHFLCLSLYTKLKEAGYENDGYAVMYTITCEQNFLRKAVFVDKTDFESSLIISEINEQKYNPRFSNHYPIIFRDHKNCEIKKVNIENISVTDHYHAVQKKNKKNKVIEFLKAFSANVVIYPLVTPLWPLLKRVWPQLAFLKRSRVALIEEIQISRSICTRLSFSGYGFEFIKDKLNASIKKQDGLHTHEAEEQFHKIENIVEKDISDFIKQNIVEGARAAVHDYLIKKIKAAHHQYYTSYKASQLLVSEQMQDKKVVLSNMLKNPMEYGFAFACREKDIKIFCIQHGICREISPHFDYIPQITESNLPHYFIANTKKAAEVSVGFPFTKAEAIAVGITKDHYCGKKHVPHADFPGIFYISTNVYTSNSGFIKAGGDDKMAYMAEAFTINNILSKVPKNILYKTYPTQKYLDSDPCYDEVLKHKNLKLYQESKDLRYLSKHARVLVTGKATSTFNWSFLTEKPLIFLDHPHLAPLRSELIPIFKDMLFYFDLTQGGVEEEVIALLSKPVEEIEALYDEKEKKAARNKFIADEYFDQKGGAEKRAYDLVRTVF